MGKSILNKQAVREYILDEVERSRRGWACTQVSPKVIGLLDAKLKKIIRRGVHQHPSKGKTFREIL